MPDNDKEGEAGFKELLWDLVDSKLQVQLVWSRTRFDAVFNGMQPENIGKNDWQLMTK